MKEHARRMTKQLLRYALLAAVAIGSSGCAGAKHAAQVAEPAIAEVRATPAEGIVILRARQRVAAAEERQWQAGDAVVEAQRFLSRAAEEQQRAGLRLAATRRAASDVTKSQLEEIAADQRLAAASAKRDYGAWLVSARRARFDEARAEERLAAADLDALICDVVQRARQAVAFQSSEVLEQREAASRELSAAQRRVQMSEAELTRARERWDQMERRSAAAAQDAGVSVGVPSEALPAGALAPIVVLLGPPGSGKSTQARLLEESFGFVVIASGDLLRAEAARPTALGRRIADAQARGALVADEIVNQVVAERIAAADRGHGVVLDGYPRTLAQARFLDELVEAKRWSPPLVLHLDVPAATLIERLQTRARSDDTPAALAERLRAYDAEIQPLVEHYVRHGRYHRIRGDRTREAVFADVTAALAATSDANAH